MSEKKWRVGMIGAGAWSDIQLNAWAGVGNAEVVALADRHPERRDPVVRRFNIPQGFDNFESMLDNAELDFVDICTRPYSHVPLTKMTVERGLPVLCQKPFCESIEEAKELVEFCDKAGVRLMVNENWRWQAWHRKARELLDSGALGKPFLVTIRWRLRMTLPGFDFNQGYFPEMERFITYEMGVHYMDTLRYLFGEPNFVFARHHRLGPDMKGEDVNVLVVAYDDMTVAIDTSFASVEVPGVDRLEENPDTWSPSQFRIEGTEGTLILGVDRSLTLVTDTDRQEWQFPSETFRESFASAQQHFVDCLESGADFETSGSETLKTMALVYACYRSAEEERPVDPKEFLGYG
jgi:predicted dehydrogenase